MKRSVIAGTAVLAVAGAAASPVIAGPAPDQVTGAVCQRALDPPNRAIEITAVMRPLSATQSMRLKFTLLRKSSASTAFVSVTGGDLGRWRAAPRGLGQRPADVWRLTKQVINLSAPATYRLRVAFRWIGEHGRVLGDAVRSGPTCYQPELRPDLLVRSISVQADAGKPADDSYLVVIANRGATAAGPFQVEFTDGGVSQHRTTTRLGRHASRQMTFVGLACSATTRPTVTVDPTDQVDDYNRANNSLTASCPTHGRRAARR